MHSEDQQESIQTSPGQTIRLFVSSTFRDMHAERDHLNRFVFPELRSRCLRHGVEFVAVDLRWGVTQEEAEQRGALTICLEEIERCRPFFLGILGDRYGWVPPPEEIPLAFREGLDGPAADEAQKWLEAWYELDQTAAEAVFRLRRDKPAPWDVGDELVRFWEQVGLPQAGQSITAREIESGLPGKRPMQSIFFIRRSGLTEQLHFPPSFVPVFLEQDPARREQQAKLKDRLRGMEGLVVREYSVEYDGLHLDATLVPEGVTKAEKASLLDGVIQPEEWPGLGDNLKEILGRHGTVALRGLEAWGEQVLDDLWRAIQGQLAAAETPKDAHEQERAYHYRFMEERSQRFYGREALLEEMLAYAGGPADPRPMVVSGPPGSGKSALLAVCAQRCQERFPQAVVLPYFVGVGPGSTGLTATIRSLCEALRRECGLEDEIAADPEEVQRQLPLFLEKAGRVTPVILLIDALNQLDPAGLSQALNWFPFHLPPETRIITSALAGPALERLQAQLPADHLIQVPPLPEADRRQLIDQHLAIRGKKLSDEQIERLLDTDTRFEAGRPLYLLVALEELALYGDYDTLNERIDTLPATLPELFDQVLAGLEGFHGAEEVSAILSWLAVSRSGLQEAEILDLLASKGFDFKGMRWGRFYRALEFYLQRLEEEDRSGILNFYHDQLRLAVFRRYFSMVAPEAAPSGGYLKSHDDLADYFQAIATTKPGMGKPETWRTDRPRGLSELPFHLARSERWVELKHGLTDFGFLQAKIEVFGPYVTLEDYDLVDLAGKAFEPEAVESMELIQGALRLSAHVLAKDSGQLAGQLLGRLLGETQADVLPMLEQAKGWRGKPWLRSLRASLPGPGGFLRSTWPGSGAIVRAIVVTPDGKLVVTGSDDGALRLWEIANDQMIRLLGWHEGRIDSLAIDGDGKRLLSGGAGGQVRVWDLASGELIQILAGHEWPVRAVTISADGRRAISVAGDKTIVWDVESGQPLLEREGHEGYVSRVALLPGDRLALSPANDRRYQLWDIKTGAEQARLGEHDATFATFAISADGRLAALAGADWRIRIWDLEQMQEVTTLAGHRQPINAIAMGPGGLVLSAAEDKTVSVWRVGSGEDAVNKPQVVLRGHQEDVKTIAVTADGTLALSGSSDGRVKVWSLPEGPESSPAQQAALTVQASGNYIFTRDEAHTFTVWEMDRAQELFKLDGYERLTGVPAKGWAILKSTQGGWQLWDLNRREQLASLPGEGPIAVTPDGQQAIMASEDGRLDRISLPGGRVQASWDGHPAGVKELAISPDGRFVLSAGFEGATGLWDVSSGSRLASAKGAAETGRTLWFDPAGRLAFVAQQNGDVLAWDLERLAAANGWWAKWSGRFPGRQRRLRGHRAPVTALVVTPDGQRAITAGRDGSIRIWDLARAKPLRVLQAEGWEDAILTPDGRYAVTRQGFGLLTLWDLAVEEEGRSLDGNLLPGIALSPEGGLSAVLVAPLDVEMAVKRGVVVDFSVIVWDLASGKVTAEFTGDVGWTSRVVAPDGQTIVAGDESGQLHILRFEGAA